MRAQAVEVGLGAGCAQAVAVRRPPAVLRGSAHGVHARQHEHLVRRTSARHERGGEAERVADDDRRGRQETPPPAREAGADAHPGSAPDGAERARARASSGSSTSPAGGTMRPVPTSITTSSGSPSSTRAAVTTRRTCRPCAAAATHTTAITARPISAIPGT